MSLVLEALRRVEKPDPAGGVAVAVAPSRSRRARGPAAPLLLGLAVGFALVMVFSPEADEMRALTALRSEPQAEVATPAPSIKPRRPLPPMKIVLSAKRSGGGGSLSAFTSETPAAAHVARSKAPLILQAISERDARPVAIINDQLVKEGGHIGAALVLKIGPDSVEVLLENGRREMVRFAPPPPETSPTPDPR